MKLHKIQKLLRLATIATKKLYFIIAQNTSVSYQITLIKEADAFIKANNGLY